MPTTRSRCFRRSAFRMKITGLRIFARPDARPPWIFLKLYTNAGIEGLGEATSNAAAVSPILIRASAPSESE